MVAWTLRYISDLFLLPKILERELNLYKICVWNCKWLQIDHLFITAVEKNRVIYGLLLCLSCNYRYGEQEKIYQISKYKFSE